MEKKKTFNFLEKAVSSLGIDLADIEEWLELKKTVSSERPVFPIVYKIGENEFEVLPQLDLARKDEVWGYEIAPNVIMALKNRELTWYEMVDFAKSTQFQGKTGYLLSKDALEKLWTNKLVTKIGQMTKFLQAQGFDAEKDGWIWSSTENNSYYAWILNMTYGIMYSSNKNSNIYVRAVVVF